MATQLTPIRYTITRMVSEENSFTNAVYIAELPTFTHYVKINNYIFRMIADPEMLPNHIALGVYQRKLLNLTEGTSYDASLFEFIVPPTVIATKISLSFILKPASALPQTVDYTNFTTHIINTFRDQYVAVGQQILCKFNGIKFIFTVTSLETLDNYGNTNATHGKIVYEKNTAITTSDNTRIRFVTDDATTTNIIIANIPDDISDDMYSKDHKLLNINPYDLEKLGIGGLSTEFITLFRRAFISRLLPQSLLKKLEITHCKGVLLYGPPGTGKTLIARKIGEMLNCREPKIVNGPEIFSKWVGQSEENIRKLFADAEKEQKEKGDKSDLHLIIFDEFDALVRQRGSSNSSTSAGDNVVNQILSKMDGVNGLNNVLLIGLTNRKDLIDDAVLRPGRFEVHIEISLPDENGRMEILNIHTKKLKDNKMLGNDVDIPTLATITKNFSGAELAGLVRSAQSYSIKRHVDPENPSQLKNIETMCVYHTDFINAISEIKPAFGQSDDITTTLEKNSIINYGYNWSIIDHDVRRFTRNFDEVASKSIITTYRILLHGDSGTGKTTISRYISSLINYPYVKVITPSLFIGYTIDHKINMIRKAFTNAYQSKESIIILDDIERLIEFSDYGRRYSNEILQTLLVLINENTKNGHKLIIICTCKNVGIIDDLELGSQFDNRIEIPRIDPTDIPAIKDALHITTDTTAITSLIPIKKLIMQLYVNE